MLTNGQDQSATSDRERKRQALEYAHRTFPKALSIPERTAHMRLQRAFEGIAREEGRRIGTISELGSTWNIQPGRRHYVEQMEHHAVAVVRLRHKLTGLTEGFKMICERWSLDAPSMPKLLHLEDEIGLAQLIISGQIPPITGDLKDRMALVIGISIGLGELFDDDKAAELQWLNSTQSGLDSHSPLEHMLIGELQHIKDVVEVLDHARGLK
jgi:hypothetical protein